MPAGISKVAESTTQRKAGPRARTGLSTSHEPHRLSVCNWPDRKIVTPLIDAGLTKEDCKSMVQRVGNRAPCDVYAGLRKRQLQHEKLAEHRVKMKEWIMNRLMHMGVIHGAPETTDYDEAEAKFRRLARRDTASDRRRREALEASKERPLEGLTDEAVKQFQDINASPMIDGKGRLIVFMESALTPNVYANLFKREIGLLRLEQLTFELNDKSEVY
jgi:hypothetical protein